MDPVKTIWATSQNDPFAYSIDGGSTWVPVSTASITGTVWSNGLCGPKTIWKFYSQFDEGEGVWYFDETGWHSEPIWFSADVSEVRPTDSAIWCNADDTLVVSVSDNQIRARPGAPGTAWSSEYTSATSPIYDVHGTPDSARVYAVASDGTQVDLLQRSGGGTWIVAHTFYGTAIYCWAVRVVSATEIWLAGQFGNTGKIWKWNGSSLTEEFSDSNGRNYGIISMYMAEDGSEGWAAYQSSGATYETSFVYYNGSTWTLTQSVSYDSECSDITQIDGDPTSAKLMLQDGSFREYDGASWDTTYTDTPVTGVATPAMIFKWVRQGFPPYLDSQTPAASTTDPQVLVDVNVLDSDDNLDTSTLAIFVNDGTGEVLAYALGSFVAPYNGGSSAITVIANGINIVIDRTTDYPLGTVTVRIQITDLSLNSIDESWSFAMAQSPAPYLDNQAPAPSSASDDKQLLIAVDVLDNQDDLDPSTINVYVDDGGGDGEVQAYNGSSFLTPYDGASSAVTSIANGRRVVVDRVPDYVAAPATVRITASDTSANSMDESWGFTIFNAFVRQGTEAVSTTDGFDEILEGPPTDQATGYSRVTQYEPVVDLNMVEARLTNRARYYVSRGMHDGTGLQPVRFVLGAGWENPRWGEPPKPSPDATEVAHAVYEGVAVTEAANEKTLVLRCAGEVAPAYRVQEVMVYAQIINSPVSGESFKEIPFASATFPEWFPTTGQWFVARIVIPM